MAKLYFKNGMILPISDKHWLNLMVMYLISPLDKMVKLPNYPAFKLSDLVESAEELHRINQITMDLGVYPQAIPKKRMNNKKNNELA